MKKRGDIDIGKNWINPETLLPKDIKPSATITDGEDDDEVIMNQENNRRNINRGGSSAKKT